MKRPLLALSILLLCSSVDAQMRNATAALSAYAQKVLPSCPGGTVVLEPAASGPLNFNTYSATVRSTDQYCGTKKFLLHSPRSQQVLIGTVIALPSDARPVHERVAARASEALRAPVRVTVAPFPLPDGLKAVTITRDTPHGPFSHHAFVDASAKFLVVGLRGSLTGDPTKSLLEQIVGADAARRGSAAAKVEIIELSDFQCPTCAAAHELIEPLIQKNLSKINYIRVDLPLFETHKWAIPAAMGARAIQRVAPKHYWKYVDYVFTNQEQIGKRSFDEVLQQYVEDNDLDWPAIRRIYASKSERQALLDQVSRIYALGIASTPTFIVNGQIVGFGPEGRFTIDAIKSAIGTPAAKKSKK